VEQDDGYEQLETLKDVMSRLFLLMIEDMQKFADAKKVEDMGPRMADMESQLNALRERYQDAQQQLKGALEDNARLQDKT
jgi:hypothetical protein